MSEIKQQRKSYTGNHKGADYIRTFKYKVKQQKLKSYNLWLLKRKKKSKQIFTIKVPGSVVSTLLVHESLILYVIVLFLQCSVGLDDKWILSINLNLWFRFLN